MSHPRILFTFCLFYVLSIVSTHSQSLSTLQDQYLLSWHINETTLDLTVIMRANTTGWIAFGIEDMSEDVLSSVNADVYIGVVDGTAVRDYDVLSMDGTVVRNYDVLSMDEGCDRVEGRGVCVNVNGSMFVYDVWSEVDDGWTSIGFRRPVSTGVNFDVVEGVMRVVVAYGVGKDTGYHGEGRRARLLVDFFGSEGGESLIYDSSTKFTSFDENVESSDESGTENSKTYLRIIHALAMSMGWLLLHLGSLYARFGKEYPNKTWFRVHRALQTIGYITAMFGFGWIISNKVIEKSASHFDQPLFHGLGGLVIMGASTLQVILACLRPQREENGEGSFFRTAWEWKHHILGRFVLIGGTVVIGIGIYNLLGDVVNIYFGFYAGVIFCIILLTIIMECGKCCATSVTHNFQMINL